MADLNLLHGTVSDGGGSKTFTDPTNANDGASTTTVIGAFAAGVGNYTGYLVSDLGAAYEVAELVVWGEYECSTDPTATSSTAPDGGWSIQYSDNGSSW